MRFQIQQPVVPWFTIPVVQFTLSVMITIFNLQSPINLTKKSTSYMIGIIPTLFQDLAHSPEERACQEIPSFSLQRYFQEQSFWMCFVAKFNRSTKSMTELKISFKMHGELNLTVDLMSLWYVKADKSMLNI